MTERMNSLKSLSLVVALAILGLLLACSQNYSSAPDQGILQPLDSTDDFGLPQRLSDLKSDEVKADEPEEPDIDSLEPSTFVTADTAVIDPSTGGVVTLDSLAGTNYLYVAPASFPTPTEFTIAVYRIEAKQAGDADQLLFQFGPDGLVFTEAAELVLDRRQFVKPEFAPPTVIQWEYFDPDTRQWTFKQIVEISNDNCFHIPVNHFSSYRAFTRVYGGLSAGGQ